MHGEPCACQLVNLKASAMLCDAMQCAPFLPLVTTCSAVRVKPSTVSVAEPVACMHDIEQVLSQISAAHDLLSKVTRMQALTWQLIAEEIQVQRDGLEVPQLIGCGTHSNGKRGAAGPHIPTGLHAPRYRMLAPCKRLLLPWQYMVGCGAMTRMPDSTIRTSATRAHS
jgi:hypothetical protein